MDSTTSDNISISESRTCGAGHIVLTLTLPYTITLTHISALSALGALLCLFDPLAHNLALESPYFKIAVADYIIRGAAFSPCLTVHFQSTDSALCHKQLAQILQLIDNS